MPHLNKTSSIVVNEQFRKQYKFVGENKAQFNRSSEDKVNSISRENIKIAVSKANFNQPLEYMMRKIKVDPPSPKLIMQSTRPIAASVSIFQGLNRSDVERNLNQSSFATSAGALHEKQLNKSLEGNLIAQKVNRQKLYSNNNERQSSKGPSSSLSKSTGKQCRQEKSISTGLFNKERRSEGRHNFKLGHSYENFQSQLTGGKKTSLEIEHAGHTRTTSSTVMILNNGTAAKQQQPGTTRARSNLSSGKLSITKTSGRPTLPRTPQSSNKLKMKSARKHMSSSLYDEVATPSQHHNFNSKRKSRQPTSAVNSINQSMQFDSSTQQRGGKKASSKRSPEHTFKIIPSSSSALIYSSNNSVTKSTSAINNSQKSFAYQSSSAFDRNRGSESNALGTYQNL